MVAFNSCDDNNYDQNPRTLGDWVKNFRVKKMQMKRKLRTSSGGELRVCAILSTALMSAELELRRKQQERFQKWLEFQAKIKNHELENRRHPQKHCSHQENNEIVLLASDDESDSDANRCKQSDEITNLWKCELSELDNFMRSISSSSSNKNRCRNNSDDAIDDCDLCHYGDFKSQPLTSQQSIRVSS